MTQGYRGYNDAAPAPANFESKLRASLGRRVQRGQSGIDLNEGKKGQQPFIVHMNHSMSEDVIRLGCEVAKKLPALDPLIWVHWMTDATVIASTHGVRVLHRSAFFCQYADRNLGGILREHFDKPVRFDPDPSIAGRVEL